MQLGVISQSYKENEQRAPIHLSHLPGLPAAIRERMVFERGYGERFGMSDGALGELVGGLASRDEVFATSDVVLLPKPTPADFESFRQGQVIWGWPHCVQGPDITQVAIDKKLTLIAWEEMHHWDGDAFHLHVFHVNNELAGYCSVLHALNLRGLCGLYGPHRKVAVIGFGSVGRGAVHALLGQGYRDLTLFTGRPAHAIRAPIPGLKHWQYARKDDGTMDCEVILTEERMPMAQALGHFDIVVNAILQDTDAPQMFVRHDELDQLRERSVIVDVSCDEGMGFEFAKPTSFESPTFEVGDQGVLYYAVDHSPSYLWDSATHGISEALVPFIADVLAGPEAWDANPTLRRAIEIREGVVQNPRILRFQNREEAYPHRQR